MVITNRCLCVAKSSNHGWNAMSVTCCDVPHLFLLPPLSPTTTTTHGHHCCRQAPQWLPTFGPSQGELIDPTIPQQHHQQCHVTTSPGPQQTARRCWWCHVTSCQWCQRQSHIITIATTTWSSTIMTMTTQHQPCRLPHHHLHCHPCCPQPPPCHHRCPCVKCPHIECHHCHITTEWKQQEVGMVGKDGQGAGGWGSVWKSGLGTRKRP